MAQGTFLAALACFLEAGIHLSRNVPCQERPNLLLNRPKLLWISQGQNQPARFERLKLYCTSKSTNQITNETFRCMGCVIKCFPLTCMCTTEWTMRGTIHHFFLAHTAVLFAWHSLTVGGTNRIERNCARRRCSRCVFWLRRAGADRDALD